MSFRIAKFSGVVIFNRGNHSTIRPVIIFHLGVLPAWLEFIEHGGGILPGVRPVANVMLKSTRLFEGPAIRNLMR
jgi:hypothetical protein